jgi:hypothetical protein
MSLDPRQERSGEDLQLLTIMRFGQSRFNGSDRGNHQVELLQVKFHFYQLPISNGTINFTAPC